MVKLKKTLLIFTLLSVTFLLALPGLVNAEPTVRQILEKVAGNTNKTEDMKATQIVIWKVEEQEYEHTTRVNYYYKRPDKTRSEVLSPTDNTTIVQTEIQDGMNYTIIDYKGRVFTRDITEFMEAEKLPMHLDFIAELDTFLENNEVSINNSESDPANNLYVLDVISKEENELFSKMELYIDYNKGIELKEKLYDDQDKLKMTIEHQDYQLINGNIWFSPKTTITTIASNGVEVLNIATYEDVKINTGIDDSLFAP